MKNNIDILQEWEDYKENAEENAINAIDFWVFSADEKFVAEFTKKQYDDLKEQILIAQKQAFFDAIDLCKKSS
ncbi:MAG TPA: hypothetical protein VGB37_07540 [Candidatus Lokiarchaeia archaeon]